MAKKLKVREDLLREIVRTIDALNANGIELLADVPAAFYCEDGRNEKFKLTWRGDDDDFAIVSRGFFYEVTL